jgi:hypothetical protein
MLPCADWLISIQIAQKHKHRQTQKATNNSMFKILQRKSSDPLIELLPRSEWGTGSVDETNQEGSQ